MRRRPEIGHAILKDIRYLRDAAGIILCHEERGYPRGLAGGATPLGARLFAVIDTLDAITSDRPHRAGLRFDNAKAEIQRCSGEQFDPVAVEAFLAEEAALREMPAAKCGAELPQASKGHGLGLCTSLAHGYEGERGLAGALPIDLDQTAREIWQLGWMP